MTFDELTNEGKLLFVIFAAERTAGYHTLLSSFYDCGPPMGSYSQAATEVRLFVFDSQRVSSEERRRRKEQHKKAEARMRA